MARLDGRKLIDDPNQILCPKRKSLDQHVRFARRVDKRVSGHVSRNTTIQGLLACPFRRSVLVASSVAPMIVEKVKSLPSVGKVSNVAAYAGGNRYWLGKPGIIHRVGRL
ncbi:hypothetical protein ASD99_15385 [Mesorhizobium sp. Root695]|nr:hypothetical protein ASD99_15385 [Mesorhizobium sp. Root695]